MAVTEIHHDLDDEIVNTALDRLTDSDLVIHASHPDRPDVWVGYTDERQHLEITPSENEITSPPIGMTRLAVKQQAELRLLSLEDAPSEVRGVVLGRDMEQESLLSY